MVKGIENALFKYIFDYEKYPFWTWNGIRGYCICLKCWIKNAKAKRSQCMDIIAKMRCCDGQGRLILSCAFS